MGNNYMNDSRGMLNDGGNGNQFQGQPVYPGNKNMYGGGNQGGSVNPYINNQPYHNQNHQTPLLPNQQHPYPQNPQIPGYGQPPNSFNYEQGGSEKYGESGHGARKIVR